MFRPLTKRIKRRVERLRTTTLREFDGGLNVIDNDLNLAPRFAKNLVNLTRQPDGSLGVRYGTRLFADVAGFGGGGNIVHGKYFNNFLILITDIGEVIAVDASGTLFLLFDQDLALLLPGNPPGWSGTTFATMSQFKSDLIICNGVDKSLIVGPNLFVTYLNDLATGSNANTPIGRIVFNFGNYVVMSGQAAAGTEDQLHISQLGASGTWEGDSDTDATSILLGGRVPNGPVGIRGFGSFRNQLLVAFEQAIVAIQLGVYNDSGDHKPTVTDVVEQHGSISHHTVLGLSGDMLSCDNVGVTSMARTALSTAIRPTRVSELIDPKIKTALSKLSTLSLEERVFGVRNRAEGQYMLFVPSDDVRAHTVETQGFIYTSIPSLKVKSWATTLNWKWNHAIQSDLDRLFFLTDKAIFVYGTKDDPIHADFVGDQETYSDGTVHTDGTGWTPISDEATSGVPIAFDWELPWADFDERLLIKKNKYINVETLGRGEFTIEGFVDNLFLDKNDPGETYTDGTLHTDGTGYNYETEHPPHVLGTALDMIGGDNPGFGADKFGEQFGGGRNAADERLYDFPLKGKIFKFRIHGETMEPLRFVSMTFGYQKGSIRR